MSDSRIGIKVADGSFYPVMEDGKPSRKKLVLTTVNDSQTNVQIDLYRGREEIEDASYVGSLLIENIPPDIKGQPEIELIIGLDEDGNLSAEASEHTSGEKRTLSVKIGEGSDMTAYDIPEFDLTEESSAGFEPDFSFDELDTDVETPDFGADSDYDDAPDEDFSAEPEEPVRKGRIRPLLIALLVILSLAFAALLIYCLMNWLPMEKVPPLRAGDTTVQEAPAVVSAEPAQPAEPAEPAQPAQPAEPAEPAEPVMEVEKVRVEVEGVWYRIRRGDTLWDISSSFYSSPWLYGQIAEENKIRNPDIIFAEQKIFIPKK